MKRCGHHAAEYGPRKSSRLSGNAPKMIMVDDDVTRQLFICRSAFARYLQRAADAVDNLEEPTYVTIRGIHQWSLSMELQLSTRQYSAILIGCGLVEEYGDTVRMNKDGWNFFLENYALRCPVTKEGVCETTRGKIKYNALQLGMIANDDDMRPMELLRIGRNKEGETIVPTKLINDGADPPQFPINIRTWHRRLFNDTSSELAVIHREKKELVDKVEDWVRMTDIKAKMKLPSKKPRSMKQPPTKPPPPPSTKQPSTKLSLPVLWSPPSTEETNLQCPPEKPSQQKPTSFPSSQKKDTLSTSYDLSPNQVEILNQINSLVRDFMADHPPSSSSSLPSSAAVTPARTSSTTASATASTPTTSMLGTLQQLAQLPIQSSSQGNNSTFDVSRMNQENILRELCQEMGKSDRGVCYESINSQ